MAHLLLVDTTVMTEMPVPEHGLEIIMRVSQAHRRELIQTLECLRTTLSNQGRVTTCDLLEDALTPNRLFWIEWWPSKPDAEASLHSGRFTTLMEAVRLMGRLESFRRVHSPDRSGKGLSTATCISNETKGGIS